MQPTIKLQPIEKDASPFLFFMSLGFYSFITVALSTLVLCAILADHDALLIVIVGTVIADIVIFHAAVSLS